MAGVTDGTQRTGWAVGGLKEGASSMHRSAVHASCNNFAPIFFMRTFPLVLLFGVGLILVANSRALLKRGRIEPLPPLQVDPPEEALFAENQNLRRQVRELEQRQQQQRAPSPATRSATRSKPAATDERCLITRWNAFWVVAGGLRSFVADPTPSCKRGSALEVDEIGRYAKVSGEGYVLNREQSAAACELRGCSSALTLATQRPAPAKDPLPSSKDAAAVAESERVAASADMEGCHATPAAGFGGEAFTWGMTYKVASARECCDACRAHAKACGPGEEGKTYYRRKFEGAEVEEKCGKILHSKDAGRCNTWVYCPTAIRHGGLCWSNDVWNHTHGECWLKVQADPSRPNAGAYGDYPAAYRKKHHTAPARVQWMSGVLTEKPVTVDGPHWHW